MKEYEQIRCGSLHLEAVIGSLPVMAVMVPFTWRQLFGFLPVKVAKTFWSFTLEAVGQLSPFNLEARGSPCGSILCDNGYELSSLLDQSTQGQ